MGKSDIYYDYSTSLGVCVCVQGKSKPMHDDNHFKEPFNNIFFHNSTGENIFSKIKYAFSS